MKCQEVVERMHRYIDHDLNEQEEEQLLAHMKTCKSCSEKFEILQKLSYDLEKLPDVSPPFSLVDRIMPQLDEIDRSRKEQGSTIQEMKKEEKIVPLSVHTGSALRSFRKTRMGRILMGTAAAAVVLGVAIYQHQPKQLDQAEVDNSYSVNELGQTDSYFVTGSGGGLQEKENTITPKSVDETPKSENPDSAATPEADSPTNPNEDAAQPAPASVPTNQERPESTTSNPDNRSSVSPDTAAPKENPSSDKGAVPNSLLDKNVNKAAPSSNNSVSSGTSNNGENPKSDNKGNTQNQENEVPQNTSETDKMSVSDTSISGTESEESLSSDEVSSVGMLSLDEKSFFSLVTSVSPKWLSPDGHYWVDYKDNKLSVYRLDGTKKDQKTLLQEIEIKATFVKGSWTDDSLTYNYEVEQGGKSTKYSYTITKEDQKTEEKLEDKSTTNSASQTETQSTDNKR